MNIFIDVKCIIGDQLQPWDKGFFYREAEFDLCENKHGF